MAPIHPIAHGGFDEDGQRSQDLRELAHRLLRYLWLIVLVSLLAGSAAWAYTRRQPDLYRSMAVLEIQTRDAKSIAPQNDQELKDPDAIETIIANFRNRSLMERVGRALKLSMNPDFLGYAPAQPVPTETITNLLLAGSKAALRPHTRLVDVSFDHRDPAVARQVASALVDQFVAQIKEQRTQTLEEQNAALSKKYEELKNNLRGSEQKLQDYRNSLKSDSLESVSVEDRRNYVDDKLHGLNADLTGAKGERLALESDTDLVRRAGDDPKALLAIASVAQDPPVAAAQGQASRLDAELAAMKQRYGLKWPPLIEKTAQADSAHRALTDTVRGAPSRLDSRLRAAVVKEDGLQRAVTDQEKVLLGLEGKLIPYRALQREYESDRVLVESVLQKLKESTLSLGVVQEGNFQVVEPAVQATSLANRRWYIVLGAFVVGALLASGVIAALHLLDSSVRTVDSAERLLGLPVLSTVPTIARNGDASRTLAMLQEPGAVVAESFRTLRSALTQISPRDEPRVFLFTSALPGEGKSLVAVNAAVAFAQQGLKTLLVEADLRRPSKVGALLGMGDNLPGIGDYVSGQTTPVIPAPIPRLSLLSAGTRVAMPSELLSSAEFVGLVAWMKENFDRVVIDSAPVNVVSDTLNIVGCASVVCLVVDCNSTPRKVVQRAVELLRRAGAKPGGLVLNRMPKWNGIGYHYDYSGRTAYGDPESYQVPTSRNDSHEAELAQMTASARR